MNKRVMPTELIGTTGFAALLDASKGTARNVIDAGEIPSWRDYAGRRIVKRADAIAYRDKRQKARASA